VFFVTKNFWHILSDSFLSVVVFLSQSCYWRNS